MNVRDLRQNLSVHLRRVKAGETLEVAERNVPVAILGPLPGRADVLGRLAERGLVARLAELPLSSAVGPSKPARAPSRTALDGERAKRS